jgi:hypothetical protein
LASDLRGRRGIGLALAPVPSSRDFSSLSLEIGIILRGTTMKNTFSGLCLLTAVVLAVVCVVQGKQKAELEKQLAALQQSSRGFEEKALHDQAKIENLARQKDIFKRRAELLSAEADHPRPAVAAAAPAPSGAPATPEDPKSSFGGALAKMMSDPEMKKAIGQQQEMMVNTMYGPVFKQLGLSADETTKLKALLAAQQSLAMDHAGDMFNPSQDKAAQAEAAKTLAAQQTAIQDQEKALLGDTRYAQFQDYSGSIGQRMVVNQFSQQMASGQSPLSDGQSQQLLQIMADENKNNPSPFGASAGGVTDPNAFQALMTEDGINQFLQNMEAMNQRVLDRAAGVLTADQMQAFTEFQTAQTQMQKAGLTLTAKMLGGSQPGAPATAVPTSASP